jgi:3-ketosteroid 9alpha-monooxygenase subunit A
MADLSRAPYTTHPTGWFMVAWSWDLAPGEVKPMHIFSTEVVLYRTQTGEAHVVDAYCGHLGAHMGHGGCVVGENLQCPWHGWKWNTEGRNVEIANVDRVRNDVTVHQWHVREHHHVIHVWHDALGRDPFWDWPGVPEFANPDGFYQPLEHPSAATAYGVHTVTPYIHIENAADAMHFPFVHGASKPVDIDEWEEIEEHYLRVNFSILFGEGKASTRLTPDGPMQGIIQNDVYGLGLGTARLILGRMVVAQLVSVTPVDMETCLLWSTIACTRDPDHPNEPTDMVDRMIEVQTQQLRNDFHIWEHLRYSDRPKYAGVEERFYPRLRRWRDRFYPADGVDSVGEDDPMAVGEAIGAGSRTANHQL